MSLAFDTNDRVLCFYQNYFYEGRCVYTRTIESERQYFIYYTARKAYEWVPEERLRKFDEENLMSLKAILCPKIKQNLEKQSNKEYSPETCDTSSSKNGDNKTEAVLCFDGRLFYEAICVNQVKTIDGLNYYVHYVGWDHKWDEWVNESRILDMTDENIKLHIGLIAFEWHSDSFMARFPSIYEKHDTMENQALTPHRFSVGEKLLCFDGKLFFEGICRETDVVNQSPMYLIHYCNFGKEMDDWFAENRLLKPNEKNIHSHRSLIARIKLACD